MVSVDKSRVRFGLIVLAMMGMLVFGFAGLIAGFGFFVLSMVGQSLLGVGLSSLLFAVSAFAFLVAYMWVTE